MLQFVYTNNFFKEGWASDDYHINNHCNKVKVIVIIFSCCSDFALYLEDYSTDLCGTWNIGSL